MIGLEIEFVNRDENGKVAAVTGGGRNTDDCGYLWEFRSAPSFDALRAFLDVEEQLERLPLERLSRMDFGFTEPFKINKELKEAALRLGFRKTWKGETWSIYGEKVCWPKEGWSQAGIHVHFGSQVTTKNTYVSRGEIRSFDYQQALPPLNWPHIIRILDEKFKAEIKEAKRQPGLYRLKPHGVEYRSLPLFLKSEWRRVAKEIDLAVVEGRK